MCHQSHSPVSTYLEGNSLESSSVLDALNVIYSKTNLHRGMCGYQTAYKAYIAFE